MTPTFNFSLYSQLLVHGSGLKNGSTRTSFVRILGRGGRGGIVRRELRDSRATHAEDSLCVTKIGNVGLRNDRHDGPEIGLRMELEFAVHDDIVPEFDRELRLPEV